MNAATVVLLVAAAMHPLDVHIMNGGHVRIADGPELTLPQFQLALQKLTSPSGCPEMRVLPEKTAAYNDVTAVLEQLQRFRCNRLGFVGSESSN